MSWLQLHIDTSAASASDIESALLQLGAVSVTLQDNADQPLLEPGVGETPLWDAIQLTALFDGDSDSEKIINRLLKTLGGTQSMRQGTSFLCACKNPNRYSLNKCVRFVIYMRNQ